MTATIRLSALIVALALAAGAAGAADRDGAAAPVRIDAGPKAAVEKRTAPLTADQKALEEIARRGQAEVGALVETLKGMPYGPAREALEKKVVQVKIQHRVTFLRALAGQQRARGKMSDALVTEAIAEQLEHPAAAKGPVEPQGVQRVTPGK